MSLLIAEVILKFLIPGWSKRVSSTVLRYSVLLGNSCAKFDILVKIKIKHIPYHPHKLRSNIIYIVYSR